MSMTPIIGFKLGIFNLQRGPCGLCVQDVAKDCAIVWRFRWVQGLALRFMRGQEHHAIAKGVFGLMCNIRYGLLINEVR